MFKFLNSTPARLVTLLLVVQGALLYSSIRPEVVPDARPLSEFPQAIGPWQEVQEGVIDQETRDVLKADDLLNRVYVDRAGKRGADLFVAAFRTQRNGKAPHSPKNCLPGNGWTPLNSSEFQIDVGRQEPITVNRWMVAHGDERSLVLYWYQSRDRAIASEYKAKFWVILDAMRLNRTDTALIRIVVPVANRDEDRAVSTAVDFVKAFYGALRQNLPA
jgi:EpsI family protein